MTRINWKKSIRREKKFHGDAGNADALEKRFLSNHTLDTFDPEDSIEKMSGIFRNRWIKGHRRTMAK